MKPIFLALISVCFLASCSSGLRMEKRHYRDGFYISKSENRAEQKVETQVAVETPGAIESTQTDAQTISESQAVDTTFSDENALIEKPKSLIHKVDSARKELSGKIEPIRDSLSNKVEQAIPYNGPSDAKGLVLLHHIAVTLLLSAVVLFGLGILLQLVYWEGMILLLIAPMLALISYGLSLAVMILAMERYKKYVGKDPETAEFYRRMRNRSLAIVIGISILLLFVLFLWLVSITGFGF
jgi:hypothetical protein